MPKVNWSIVAAGVIAGVVVLLIQEFAFKRKLNPPPAKSPLRPSGCNTTTLQ